MPENAPAPGSGEIPLRPGGPVYAWPGGAAAPGSDSFALAHFFNENAGRGTLLADLCSGAGLLSLLAALKNPELCVHGLELDPAAHSFFEENIARFGFGGRVFAHHADIRKSGEVFPGGGFDFVLSNPPYYKKNSGKVSRKSGAARAEISCGIADVCAAAGRLLKNRGQLFVCFLPERLPELFDAMRACKIEPKRLRPVCHSPLHPPSVLLVCGVKGARPGLVFEKSLFLSSPGGSPSPEAEEICRY